MMHMSHEQTHAREMFAGLASERKDPAGDLLVSPAQPVISGPVYLVYLAILLAALSRLCEMSDGSYPFERPLRSRSGRPPSGHSSEES